MALGLFSILAAPAAAATRTWDGGGADSNWTTAANWQGNVAPIADDVLVFPAGIAKNATVNNFPADTEFDSLTFGATYAITGNRVVIDNGITLSSADNVAFFGDIVLKSPASFNFVDVVVATSGLIRFEGVLSGGVNGILRKSGPGRLRLTETNTYLGSTIIQAGQLQIQDIHALGSIVGQTVIDGGILELSVVGGGTIAESMTLTANAVDPILVGAITAFEPANLTGTIGLTGTGQASIFVNSGITLTIPGVVSGGAGFNKLGPGTLDFTGPVSNTYGGETRVFAGVLQLSRTNGVAVPGKLVVGDGQGGLLSDLVRLTQDNQINPTAVIVIDSTGWLDLTSHQQVAGPLGMSGGKISSTGAGQLTLGDIVEVGSTGLTNKAVIEGRLSLGSTTRLFLVDGDIVPSLDVTAVVSGGAGAGITASGTGRIRLAGANTYDGPTTINGKVMAAHAQAFGSPAAGTTVAKGAVIEMETNIAAEPLIVQGDGLGVAHMYCDAAGTQSWGGPITIDGVGTFSSPGPCSLRLNGVISGGAFQAWPFSTGHVELGAVNTYTGPTSIAGVGELRLATNNAIPDTSVVTIASGTFNLAGFSDTIAGLNAGQNRKVMLGAGTLTVSSLSGTSTVCHAVISGTGKVVTQGFGVWALTAQNTYTGLTTIQAGTLQLTGGLVGPVTMTGGNLSGSGLVANSVTAFGGEISPNVGFSLGDSAAKLGIDGISLNPSASLQIEIIGSGAGEYDQLETNGLTVLGNATLTLDASPLLQMSNVGELVILKNDTSNPITGTFDGLPNGATVTSAGKSFVIHYDGGDGNDVSLTPAKRDYYLSEGATGVFFDLDILVANPNNAEAPVTFTFLLPDGGTVVAHQNVAALTRFTLNVDAIAGLSDTAVSTVVTSDSGLPLVVERTMRWDQTGYGAHTEKAASGTANNWYFAEGAQGFFSTYLLLANPNDVDITVSVVYLREGASLVARTYPVKAKSRFTVDVGADPDLVGFSFGMEVQFTQPGVAERAMYFGTDPLWKGGHESTGVTALSANWFLAEGATGPFFETFVLLANPDDDPATGTITFLPSTGVPVSKPFELPKFSRLTINVEGVDPSLANAAVATQVTATHPIIVERAQYWPDPAPEWYEAHNSFGVTALGQKWGLAEGRVGGPEEYQTYVLLANPGHTAAQVTITFLRENGDPFNKTFTIPAKSRFNVDTGVGTLVPELVDERFGALIVSDQPIAVERAMYSNANGQVWAAGTNATATALP